jgi:hypothetical protein
MKRFECRRLSLICVLAIAVSTSASRAADEGGALDLVPRDAAAFIETAEIVLGDGITSFFEGSFFAEFS